MRVALVGAEFEENLSLRYLWGALEREGHEVRLVVFNHGEEIERAARALAGSGAELAGLSMVFTVRAGDFVRVVERARELGFGGHVVAGGHFAAFHAEELLRDVPAIDSVALGEGEEVLARLAASLGDLGGVPGLVWRGEAGVVRNERAEEPPDLDTLAWPPRKAALDRYLGLPITNLLSSRGCAYRCAFCSIAAWHRLCGGPRVRYRSPERVADEMAALWARGIRIFNFHDDNFFLERDDEMFARMEALRGALARRGVGRIAFAVKARPDRVGEELFALMKSMGLFRVFLGIEAGTRASLASLGRAQTVEENERALGILGRLDLHACFNLLLWNPDSTLEDVAANVAWLRRHPANPTNFCRTEIYAGTPLERRLRRQGRLAGDYWGYDYAIADERAQAAFEVILPAFRERNFGETSLHCFAMKVDYEHQLLSHFWQSPGDLRRRVKRYVAAVNLDTCDHLEWALAAVERDGPDAARAGALARELGARIAVDDERHLRLGQALLAEIRGRALPARAGRRAWPRAAAAAGLAASMGLAGGALVPAAEARSPAAYGRRAAAPVAVAPPAGDPALVDRPVRLALERHLEDLPPDGIVSVEIWVDARGRIARLAVSAPGMKPRKREAMEAALGAVDLRAVCEAYGKRFLLSFGRPVAPATDVRFGPDTHMCEAPPPPPCFSPVKDALRRIEHSLRLEVLFVVARAFARSGHPVRDVVVRGRSADLGAHFSLAAPAVEGEGLPEWLRNAIRDDVAKVRVSAAPVIEARKIPDPPTGRCWSDPAAVAPAGAPVRFAFGLPTLFEATASYVLAPAFARETGAPRRATIDFAIADVPGGVAIADVVVRDAGLPARLRSEIAAEMAKLPIDPSGACHLARGGAPGGRVVVGIGSVGAWIDRGAGR